MEYKTLTNQELQADETKLVVALGKIIRTKDWKIVLEQHFQKRLNANRTTLENTNDSIEMYRMQGAIDELRHIFSLENVHQSLVNTTEHGKN